MKQRLVAIDILRLIAAFFVVYIHTHHTLPEVLSTLSRMAVPLFFAISGFFFFSKEDTKLLHKAIKAIKKLTFYYVLSLLLFAVYGLYQCSLTQDYSAFHFSITKIFNLLARCTSPIMPYGFHLWFLVALIEVYLLFYILCHKVKYNKEKNIRYALIISIVAYYVVMVLVKGYIPVLFQTRTLGIIFSSVLFFATPFFLMGYYIAQNKNKLYRIKKNKLIIGIISLYLVQLIEYQIVGDKTCYFSSIPFIFLILIYALQSNPSSKIALVTSQLGQDYSLLIYILHPIFVPILKDIIAPELLVVGVFVATLVFSIIIKTLYSQSLKLIGTHILNKS